MNKTRTTGPLDTLGVRVFSSFILSATQFRPKQPFAL